MSPDEAGGKPQIGSTYHSEPYTLDEEAARAYSQAIESPPRRTRPDNIHNDPRAAQRAGYPAPIAAGEHTQAVLAEFLVDLFGLKFQRGGKLEVRFIRPVFYGDTLTARVRVLDQSAEGGYELEVGVTNQSAQDVLTGRAHIPE